ncbi:hypothetical protein ACO0QE_000101 [Hanseniaspora vineae]
MNELDNLVSTIETYLQKQKSADVNITRPLCVVIAKVFMKVSGGGDGESKFTQSVGDLNSSLRKIDSSELYAVLTNRLNEPDIEEQRKKDEPPEGSIETHQNNDFNNNKPPTEAKSMFKKRKKFVVANVEPLPNKKVKSPLLGNDDEDDEEEEGIGATIMFNRQLANKQKCTESMQKSPEPPSESSRIDLLHLESEINGIKQKIQHCLSTANKHFQNSKGSTSYIENEHYKLTPVSLKERLQLVPPFLQTLNERYMPVKATKTSQLNDTNYLLDIIMGSLLPSNSASTDGPHTDLIEGKIEISNDENGELTQSCNKSSKMLVEYKKVVEQKKHVKNIVLNDTLQRVTEQDQNSSVQEEEVVDDDEVINTDEDEEEKDSTDISESPRFIDNSHTLPVYACKQDFLKVLQENQVVLVIGETGSGKTTQLPKYIYEQDRETHKIAITQPRRVAAMSIAQRISDELQCELGKEVGYAVRFDDKTDKNLTRIKVMTDGILLRDFLTMSSSSQIDYTHIIIDEAHERSLNTDVLLGFIKQLLLLKQNRLLKIIITSATINFKTFLQHFLNAPVFKIPGKTFPVQSIYLKRPAMDYIETIIQSIVKLHLSNPVEENNDVLCFMTGQDDIEISCAMLEDKLTQVYAQAVTETPMTTTDEKESKNFVILPLYSTLSPKKQALVFQKFPGKRKIIICTNIAETSITIDGIKFVVDAGFHKLKLYNSKIGLNVLKTVPISKDMSVQRQGRAGRTQPGVVYKMYTESCFNFELLKNSIPEIKRTNLSNVLLMLLSAQEGSSNLQENYNSVEKILKFPFMEKPSKLTLLSSFLELYNLQAVDNTGDLTSLGFKMSRVPIPPNLSKMLILSKQATFDCFDEILIIVGMLSIESNSGAGYFQRPKNFEKLADSKRLNFVVPYSDHLTLLNLYSKWQYNNCSIKWCERNFINHRALLKVGKIVEQLQRVANGIGVGTVKSNKNANRKHHQNTWENVKKCVTTGYSYRNIGKKIGLNKYMSLQNGMTLQIHPTSSLFGLPDLPPYIIYHDLLLTSKEYINCVTAVDPVWIMEYQPFYFNIHAAVSEENGEVVHPTNNLEQLEALQNLRKYSINLLEKQKGLALIKSQLAKEERNTAAHQEHQTYMSNMSSLKTFKKRKKMGF